MHSTDLKPIKPGSRPRRDQWCSWLQAIVTWNITALDQAYARAGAAYRCKSIQAQYAALSEMHALEAVYEGRFYHQNFCSCSRRNIQPANPKLKTLKYTLS